MGIFEKRFERKPDPRIIFVMKALTFKSFVFFTFQTVHYI